MPSVDIQYGAVVVGAIISMVVGALWYSPVLFAGAWMKEIGKKKEDLRMDAAKMGYLFALVASLVLSYIMAHFVQYTNATTFVSGAITGIWLWIGFVATTGTARVVFRGDSFKLFAIDYGYNLVQFALIGGLLGVWR